MADTIKENIPPPSEQPITKKEDATKTSSKAGDFNYELCKLKEDIWLKENKDEKVGKSLQEIIDVLKKENEEKKKEFIDNLRVVLSWALTKTDNELIIQTIELHIKKYKADKELLTSQKDTTKEAIIGTTQIQTKNLETQIQTFPKTPEWTKKAFEALKNAEIPDKASRNFVLNYIIGHFIHSQQLSIVSTKDWLSVVNQKFWNINNDYNSIIKENITKEEFDNLTVINSFVYNINGKEKNIDELAKKIVENYNKWFIGQEDKKIQALDNIKEEDKPKIIQSILNSSLQETEKTFLITYVNDRASLSKHQSDWIKTRDDTKEKLDSQKLPETLASKGVTQQTLADVIRNPANALWNMLSKMSPISALSLFVIAIWTIIWTPFSWNSKTLAWLLTLGAWYWVLDAMWYVESFAKSVENWGIEKSFDWAKQKVGNIQEAIDKWIWWYKYSDVKFVENWTPVELINANFNTTLKSANTGTLTSYLLDKDNKTLEAQDVENIKNQLNEYKNLWMKKFWESEEKFLKRTEWKNIAEVIKIIIADKPSNKTSDSWQNNPSIQGGETQQTKNPTQAKPRSFKPTEI